MPVEANAKIVIKGGPESLKVLQGVRRESNAASRELKKAAQDQEKAQRAATRAAEASAKAQQKTARDSSRARQKADADAVRSAQKAQREVERVAQKQADYWQRAAQKSADARIRAEERATVAARREAAKQEAVAKKSAETQAKDRRDTLRRAGGLLSAGAAGLLAGAAVAGGTARGIAGVKDVRERIASANEFRERLVLATGSAGMGAQEREAVQGKVLAASTSTGKDIGELMGVLETGQAQFNNLKFFADNLKEIATISKVAGADTGELAKALGFVQQAFGLSGDEAMEAAYLMKASADKGAVELKDFARDFAASAGIFAMNTQQKGLAGVRQFLGASQGVATGGFGSAESATRLERFITDLNDVDVQKGLRGIGIKNVIDKTTGKIDVANVIEQLGTNKKFQKASTRQGIFKDVRGQQAVESLMAARGRVKAGVAGAVDLETISQVDAAAGRTAVTTGMKSLEGEGFFQMQQEAARMQADTVANLKSYNDQVLLVTKTADRLEKSFGTLSLWANSIATVGIVGAGVNTVGKLAGAGPNSTVAKALPSVANAGSAVASGAGAAIAAGSTAVAAATGAAIAGTVAAGLAIGAGLGYGANELTSAVRDDGKSISELLADALFEAMNKNDARFKPGGDAATSEDGAKRIVAVMQENNRKLESIDQGLRTTTQKTAPGAPRGPR